jgi:tetratricopeptide (TPR) repeat protein
MTSVDGHAALHEALAAEEAQRWAESMILCRQALADASVQPDAFNLFGRLCRVAGDAANAIASQRYVLRLAPDHARAAEDLRIACGAIRSAPEAVAAFRAAVVVYPDVTCHHRDPASLLPFVGMDGVEEALQHVLELDPSCAPAHAAIGNIRARRGRGFEAVDAYRLAVMLDWDFAEAHLALAAFFDAVRDEDNAALHRREALARKQVYATTAPGATRQVLMLLAPGDPTANAPLDHCVNHARVALHRYYLAGDVSAPEFPAYDVVFNAIEEAESSVCAIARAAAFAAAQPKPVINDPAHLARVRRSALPATLHDVRGCVVPPAHRVARAALEHGAESLAALGLDGPVVVRPVDTHRGDWQERVANAAELRDYLTRAPGAHFNVTPFVDYRSADGYYRKYRVIVVGGTPFPCHLAISDAWKVHYHSSLMERHAWMREEEERFLRDPRAVFARWETVFGEVASAVGLDYFGVDCAVAADGAVLIFECGPGMLVHCADAPDLFAYKYDYVPRIFAALDGLFERVIAANGPLGSG